MRLADAEVTVKERILLHLLDYWGQMPRGEWPEVLTQDGIAAVVGISRSHVAVTLPALIEEQRVETSIQRVRGRARRVKVYGLTFQGGRVAGAIAQRLLATTVTAVDDTGEWDIPLDGLIQVHKVHMLVAIRLVDEGNRVDLRKATEMVRPIKEPDLAEAEAPEVGPEAVEGPGPEEVPEMEPGPSPGQGPERAEEVAGAAEAGPGPPPAPSIPPSPPQAPGGPPTTAPTPRPATLVASTAAPPQWGQMQGPGRAPGGGPPPQMYGYGQYPPSGYFWSPLRFGSGRRPQGATVATWLMMGFLSLGTGIAFLGIAPTTCLALWVPLVVMGVLFAYLGYRDLWVAGDRREAWTSTTLSAFAFLAVTMVAFAAFGRETLLDLLRAVLLLGLPSLLLMAGTGRHVARRGSFALVLGPVLSMSALAMAVLDPEGIGRTGAMPVLMVAAGVGWTFVGWMMVRRRQEVDAKVMVVGGGGMGLALATAAGGAGLASEDALSLPAAIAITLWTLTAAYVAAISLTPSLSGLRPDTGTSWRALAVSGAAALVTASAIFLMGGLYILGAVEVAIAVAMTAMVLPEMGEGGRSGWALAGLGGLVAVASVVAVSYAV